MGEKVHIPEVLPPESPEARALVPVGGEGVHNQEHMSGEALMRSLEGIFGKQPVYDEQGRELDAWALWSRGERHPLSRNERIVELKDSTAALGAIIGAFKAVEKKKRRRKKKKPRKQKMVAK